MFAFTWVFLSIVSNELQRASGIQKQNYRSEKKSHLIGV